MSSSTRSPSSGGSGGGGTTVSDFHRTRSGQSTDNTTVFSSSSNSGRRPPVDIDEVSLSQTRSETAAQSRSRGTTYSCSVARSLGLSPFGGKKDAKKKDTRAGKAKVAHKDDVYIDETRQNSTERDGAASRSSRVRRASSRITVTTHGSGNEYNYGGGAGGEEEDSIEVQHLYDVSSMRRSSSSSSSNRPPVVGNTPRGERTEYDGHQVEVTFAGGIVEYDGPCALEDDVMLEEEDEFVDNISPPQHGPKKRLGRKLAPRLGGRTRSEATSAKVMVNNTAAGGATNNTNNAVEQNTAANAFDESILEAVAADQSDSINVAPSDLAPSVKMMNVDDEDVITKKRESRYTSTTSTTDSDTSSSSSTDDDDAFSDDGVYKKSQSGSATATSGANSSKGSKFCCCCGWKFRAFLMAIVVLVLGLVGVMVYSVKMGNGWFFAPPSSAAVASAHEEGGSPIENIVDGGDATSSSSTPTLPETEGGGAPLVVTTSASRQTSSPTSSPTSSSPTPLPSQGPTSSQPTPLPTPLPTMPPTDPWTYIPGDLTKYENGLVLSTGLSSRIVARSGEPVELNAYSTQYSSSSFHRAPDAAAVFPDPSGNGGWIYTSNSEIKGGGGGVGSIFFDAEGRVTDYRRILRGTSKNCGGGVTPWGTWISCEENGDGQIYEVDPTGNMPPKMTVLGQRFGGNYESFTYDNRDPSKPRFFYTEDKTNGALRRFTPHPDAVAAFNNGGEAFNLLHSEGGTFEYLVFDMVAGDRGTFRWSTSLSEGRRSAVDNYINTEGIDARNGRLVFVSKKQKELFILELDQGTWTKSSTSSGVFDGQPDQVNYMLEWSDRRSRSLSHPEPLRPPMLIFTEEGGDKAGIHARDQLGNYLTLVESTGDWAETTGLTFSPDYRHMYFAFQEEGLLYDVWREDGFPFNGNVLDLKYHYVSDSMPSSTD